MRTIRRAWRGPILTQLPGSSGWPRCRSNAGAAHSVLRAQRGAPRGRWFETRAAPPSAPRQANYSSNFFRGTFERPKYFRMVDDYFTFLDGAARRKAALKAK